MGMEGGVVGGDGGRGLLMGMGGSVGKDGGVYCW